MKRLLDAIPAAQVCPVCNGTGLMRMRAVEEREWTTVACPRCAGLGLTLAVQL